MTYVHSIDLHQRTGQHDDAAGLDSVELLKLRMTMDFA